MPRRKRSAFQRCIARKLKGKKGGKAAFKRAVNACKGKGRKRRRGHRRRR